MISIKYSHSVGLFVGHFGAALRERYEKSPTFVGDFFVERCTSPMKPQDKIRSSINKYWKPVTASFIVGFSLCAFLFHEQGSLRWLYNSGTIVNWLAVLGTLLAVRTNIYLYKNSHRHKIEVSLDKLPGNVDYFLVTISNMSTLPTTIRFLGTDLDSSAGWMLPSDSNRPHSLASGESIELRIYFKGIMKWISENDITDEYVKIEPLITDVDGMHSTSRDLRVKLIDLY